MSNNLLFYKIVWRKVNKMRIENFLEIVSGLALIFAITIGIINNFGVEGTLILWAGLILLGGIVGYFSLILIIENEKQ